MQKRPIILRLFAKETYNLKSLRVSSDFLLACKKTTRLCPEEVSAMIVGYTLQHTATHCNTLQHTATTHCNSLQHTATHCNTLQHTYITLQQASRLSTWIPAAKTKTLSPEDVSAVILGSHTATRYTSLQHTATYCNTLQQASRSYTWIPAAGKNTVS